MKLEFKMSLKKYRKRILKTLGELLILALIGNLLSIFSVPGHAWSLQIILSNCAFSMGIGYPALKALNHVVVVLDRKLPWLQYPGKRLVVQFLSLSIVAGIIMLAGIAVFIWLMDISFKDISAELVPVLKVAYIFMFFSLLVGNSVLFFKNWRKSVIQQEELKRAHLALQYQSLKDQVRPHFLFNNLSSLVTLINTDPKKATLFVHKLSDVYRYVLEQRENELVPVSDEVKFLEDYIYLQKIRFGESLEVRINLVMDQKQMMIPLSLQMMVENAIKHNEVSTGHPLVIEILSAGSGDVVISNNLQKKEVTEKSPGMGIDNLRKRIAFFTRSPLLIEQGDDSFKVTIPTIHS